MTLFKRALLLTAIAMSSIPGPSAFAKPAKPKAPAYNGLYLPAANVRAANTAARVQPAPEGFINATQTYAYTQGSLFQVYTAVGKITDIALQPGEELAGTGPVAAGDTARWVIGDTVSGVGDGKQVHILVKPTRIGLSTNLVINTNRRTYHIELRAFQNTYMASVSWRYTEDDLIAVQRRAAIEAAAAPIATGLDIQSLNFNYRIDGDKTPWRPIRAFDDAKKTYIELPANIAQGELPPLFLVGPDRSSELVNYRISRNYLIVDRIFSAAEMRLGDKKSQKAVRITRVEGKMP
ncbi:P-type conjugative transfer protein TrbG [Asticcacaulis endophyticus]|uniref:Type IV secretion system protein VirB9 n=1 Tax=Asticcacaulis endophyticus TaxID=1395890 RepID=A0A918Q3T3_9CAUL|nr:P-type conjugative transfer protein TrbG [Asticcacaulis endophyticus]GGZ32256.1 hypothetical protein GCM10011273_17940 [Asticcacaulis endophyticus]